MRRQAQTSPRNPYASAPCQRNSGIRFFCSGVSLGDGPAAQRLSRAVGPLCRTRASQRLTQTSDTPKADAMSRWRQPSCFRFSARIRRQPRQSSGATLIGFIPLFYGAKNLTKPAQLSVTGTRITDAGLEHLKELRELTRLALDSTSITDVGLVYLQDLPNLREIS